MPTKCTYRRPSGRRPWDHHKFASLFRWAKKRDHVEAICSALAEEGIECGEEREEKCQKEKAQVRSLVRALDFAADSLDLANGVISAIGVMANAVALVARFVPAARPAGTLLMATHREITLVQQQVRAALEYAKLMARLQGGAVPRELAHLIPG